MLIYDATFSAAESNFVNGDAYEVQCTSVTLNNCGLRREVSGSPTLTSLSFPEHINFCPGSGQNWSSAHFPGTI